MRIVLVTESGEGSTVRARRPGAGCVEIGRVFVYGSSMIGSKLLRVGVAALSLSSLVVGCGDADPDGTGGAGGGANPFADVTYHEHIEPLLQRSCLGCHRMGQIGGFSLEQYEDVKAMSGLIANKTEAREMPPFLAQQTEDCNVLRPFVDDIRLSDDEIAMLRAWSDAGAPQGDPAKAPPPYQAPELGLASPDLEIPAAEPGVVSGTSDIFECVVYDPMLAQDEFLDGVNIVPGNTAVAHHALLFRTDREDAATLSSGNARFPCFGGPPGELIHAWAPGALPLELPQDVGIELGVNDVIVVQMHYHPTPEPQEDSSTIQLRFTDASPLYAFLLALPGNAADAGDGLLPGMNDSGEPEFLIPANAEAHVEEMIFEIDPAEVPVSLPILLVATHMHYVGVDMRFWIERPSPDGGEPAEECLVHTPAWDFNWQRGYMYDVPLSELPYAGPGDILHMRCVYNNSPTNPFVMDALEEQGLSAPVDVRLGEETLDEMCLAAVGVLVPNF